MRTVRAERHSADDHPGEIDAMEPAQTLGQLRPFIAYYSHRDAWANLHLRWADLTPFSLQLPALHYKNPKPGDPKPMNNTLALKYWRQVAAKAKSTGWLD